MTELQAKAELKALHDEILRLTEGNKQLSTIRLEGSRSGKSIEIAILSTLKNGKIACISNAGHRLPLSLAKFLHGTLVDRPFSDLFHIRIGKLDRQECEQQLTQLGFEVSRIN